MDDLDLTQLQSTQYKTLNGSVRATYTENYPRRTNGWQIVLEKDTNWVRLSVDEAEALAAMLPPLIADLKNKQGQGA